MSVLIGIVCINRDSDLCERLYKSILDNGGKDIIIVTRKTDDKIIDFWKSRCKIIRTIPHYEISGRHNMQKIAEKRNIVIKYARKNKYNSVWFIDSDIIPTQGVLNELKKTKMAVCIAPYKVKWEGEVCVGISSDKPPFVKVHAINEEDKTVPRKECIIGGFGCTLIKKEAFKQKIEYKDLVNPVTGHKVEGEDIGFFLNCYKNGIKCEYLTNMEQPHYFDR
jgi:hypothetical protein